MELAEASVTPIRGHISKYSNPYSYRRVDLETHTEYTGSKLYT
jgi:hypothetical protein